ncbi:5233_t:CDS:2, partial [Acaulospora colombiana]
DHITDTMKDLTAVALFIINPHKRTRMNRRCKRCANTGEKAFIAHGNRPTDPKRFEDGFIQGWCDAENPSYPQITVNSMIQQRHQEHVQRCGDSQCEWAFDDGKPPQQPTPQQPNTTPVTQPQVSQPNNPPTTSNPPATHQCTAECNQGKGCQHTTSTPVPAPTKPGNSEGHCDTKNGDKDDSPDEDHQCTGECKHHKKKTGLFHKLEHKIEHALKLD